METWNPDLGNLLMMFEQSLKKIIVHLEEGYPDRALIRAKKTSDAFEKVLTHCIPDMHGEVEKKI